MKLNKDQIIELVGKIQDGDKEAFATLYEEFSQRLYAYIRIKVSDETEAEDILQEVFLKAWVGCRKLDVNNLNLSAWLYKVAGNTINDYYRKKYRKPLEVPLEEANELASQDDVALDASNGLERESAEHAVAALPTHYKEVIELRFFQDFSVSETARIMGKNSVTVRVWQHRALSRLKELFNKEANDNE